MSSIAANSGLYDGDCQPVYDTGLPPLDGPGGVFQAAPLCRIMYDLDGPGLADRQCVDLIYALPLGDGSHRIASTDLSKIIACLDGGGLVGLAGMSGAALAKAADAITMMRNKPQRTTSMLFSRGGRA